MVCISKVGISYTPPPAYLAIGSWPPVDEGEWPFDWSTVGVPQKPPTQLKFAGCSCVKPAPTTMSQSNSETKILSKASFCAFIRSHGGEVGLADFVDKTTGEKFTKVVFCNAVFTAAAGNDANGKPLQGRTLTASWGPSLNGGLNEEEIVKQKDNLVVLETGRKEHYIVAKEGLTNVRKINCQW